LLLASSIISRSNDATNSSSLSSDAIAKICPLGSQNNYCHKTAQVPGRFCADPVDATHEIAIGHLHAPVAPASTNIVIVQRWWQKDYTLSLRH
jgi:hypothetical protein